MSRYRNIKKIWQFRLGGSSSNVIFKNMMLMTAGTLIGRLAGFAALPIISRLYPPESFGSLAVFMALITIITPVSTFYATAIPLPKRDSLALNVVMLSFFTLLCVLFVCGGLLALAANDIFAFFNAPSITEWWPMLILGIAFSGIFQILLQWSTRKKAFSTISWALAFQALLGAGLKIFLGVIGVINSGLLIGGVAQSGAGVAQLGRKLLHDSSKRLHNLSIKSLTRAARRFSDFALFRLPSQFLLAFTGQALLLFSAVLFDVDTTGQIALAMSVLTFPVSLLGRNIGQAYYGEVAAIGRNDLPRVRVLTASVVKRIFLVASPVAFAFLVGGPFFFTWVFGSQWELAGQIASASAPYVLASLASIPVVHVLSVIGRQKDYLRINVMRSIWTVGLFSIAHHFDLDALTTVSLYYGVLTIHLGGVLIRVFRLLNTPK